jgi:hypothetical protein
VSVICSFVAGRPGWAIGVVSSKETPGINTRRNNSNYF